MDQLVTLNRRELLKTTTGLLTGCLVAGSPLALIAPGRAWAVDLEILTSSEGATLMSMARTIAPHDKLDDAAYALVIKAVDVCRSFTPAPSRMPTSDMRAKHSPKAAIFSEVSTTCAGCRKFRPRTVVRYPLAHSKLE